MAGSRSALLTGHGAAVVALTIASPLLLVGALVGLSRMGTDSELVALRAEYETSLRLLTEQMPVVLWSTDAELRVELADFLHSELRHAEELEDARRVLRAELFDRRGRFIIDAGLQQG